MTRSPAAIWLRGSPYCDKTRSGVAPINGETGSAASAVASERTTAKQQALRTTANITRISEPKLGDSAGRTSMPNLKRFALIHRAAAPTPRAPTTPSQLTSFFCVVASQIQVCVVPCEALRDG
jgi:hypothetical protein